jgi:TRAP transporter 4TM/12TM fusion protein
MVDMNQTETKPTSEPVEVNRFQVLPFWMKVICVALFIAGLGAFLMYVFSVSIGQWTMPPVMYYYILYATFCTAAFLIMPVRKKDRKRLPWYDVLLAALVFGITVYFATKTWDITHRIWMPPPTVLDTVLAILISALAMESGRRVAGLPMIIVCLLLGVYPLFAEHMPGILEGYSYTFPELMGAFAFGGSGMLGLPAQVAGETLLAFLVFAGTLIATGAGQFFLDFALALLGRFRGGPAKVAVVASGFFGSLSGSPMTNIVTTGAITIPAMKRLGYSAHYAGAIEAVASTGGMIMPPVMGSIAFIMSVLTGIPYASILIAAFLPAILYYYGLLVQVDAYAAKNDLKGMPSEELPSMKETLKTGWPFLFVMVFLTFGLVYMRWGVLAPVYSTGLLLVLSFVRRSTWLTPKKLLHTVVSVGGLISFIMAVLFPAGFIMIGIQAPGTLTAITAQIIAFSSDNIILVLFMAMVLCYLLGMVGLAGIPYIVLAVTAIPALVAGTGMSMIGLHLFCIYYLLTTGITPPICVSAFVAAGLAGAPPMKTGFTAMRLAAVIYFIPFFFVLSPALILEGPIIETLYRFALCLLGIGILAGALEGYLLKVGRLQLWSRILLTLGGFAIAFPDFKWNIVGGGLSALVILICLIRKRRGDVTAVPELEVG